MRVPNLRSYGWRQGMSTACAGAVPCGGHGGCERRGARSSVGGPWRRSESRVRARLRAVLACAALAAGACDEASGKGAAAAAAHAAQRGGARRAAGGARHLALRGLRDPRAGHAAGARAGVPAGAAGGDAHHHPAAGFHRRAVRARAAWAFRSRARCGATARSRWSPSATASAQFAAGAPAARHLLDRADHARQRGRVVAGRPRGHGAPRGRPAVPPAAGRRAHRPAGGLRRHPRQHPHGLAAPRRRRRSARASPAPLPPAAVPTQPGVVPGARCPPAQTAAAAPARAAAASAAQPRPQPHAPASRSAPAAGPQPEPERAGRISRSSRPPPRRPTPRATPCGSASAAVRRGERATGEGRSGERVPG